MTPRIARIAVVLPAPLGPRNPNIVRGGTVERHPVERGNVAEAAMEIIELEHRRTRYPRALVR